ncbi:hypothetical protein [Streptomyces lydicus]|uniref:hypothetical protein n=1 Tax=Streptomyces lydicus TaxID=47763 RepID=UPI003797F811
MSNTAQAPAMAEGPTQHTQNQATDRPSNTYGYTREEQLTALRKLREAFPPSEIRHMPRVWCRACKGSQGGCQQHPASKCDKCGQKMPRGGHIDLRFVGHAEATNRLLNVDPFWDWEPLTVDERGLPQVDGYQGMWIRLTVCGMTRLGYGHADGKTGGDAVKEVIGDAIRNAGMRFGMALDLWTTSDLEKVETGGDDSQPQDAPPAVSQPSASAEPKPDPVEDALLNKLVTQAIQHRFDLDELTKVRGEATAKKVIGRDVPGPPPERKPMPFADLLDLLVQGAKSAQQERDAA